MNEKPTLTFEPRERPTLTFGMTDRATITLGEKTIYINTICNMVLYFSKWDKEKKAFDKGRSRTFIQIEYYLYLFNKDFPYLPDGTRTFSPVSYVVKTKQYFGKKKEAVDKYNIIMREIESFTKNGGIFLPDIIKTFRCS